MRWSKTISFNQPLRDVRQLAPAPVENWHRLLAEREEAAMARGRCEGEKALAQQIIEQRAEIADLQRGILTALQRAVPEVVREAEGALIRLTCEAAEKVVAGIPITAEMVESVVREALHQVEDTTEVVVQLHPEDLELLRKNDCSVVDQEAGNGSLRFVPSVEIARGGCVVKTRFGMVDARRETKLAQLRASLET